MLPLAAAEVVLLFRKCLPCPALPFLSAVFIGMLQHSCTRQSGADTVRRTGTAIKGDWFANFLMAIGMDLPLGRLAIAGLVLPIVK